MEISLEELKGYESVEDYLDDQQAKMEMDGIDALSEAEKHRLTEDGISSLVTEFRKSGICPSYHADALERHARHIAERDPVLFIWNYQYKPASENLEDVLSFAISDPDYIFPCEVSGMARLSWYLEADYRLSDWEKMEVLSGKTNIVRALR